MGSCVITDSQRPAHFRPADDEQLIAKFGHEKVCDALAPLVAKCGFKDWLCVANAVDHLARKVRQHRPKASTRKRPL